MTLILDFEGQILKSCISRIGGLINMEWKGYESIGCWTDYVTFSYDPWRIFKVKFQKAVSLEWGGQLTWNKGDASR